MAFMRTSVSRPSFPLSSLRSLPRGGFGRVRFARALVRWFRSAGGLGAGLWRVLRGFAASDLNESNASSGMGVAPDIRQTFLELQMKKAFRYVIFKIEEKQKQVIVEKTGATTESYDDFLASLPENDCRYALYDFDFVTGENVQKSKIFFIAWSPATSRIRAKMLYSTSKDRIKHELDGFHYEIQATDPTEVELDVLRERAH